MSDIFRSDDKRISPAIIIATACGIGFIPKAPGTFGSLPGLVLGALLHIGIANFFSSERHNPLGGESIIILLISFAILSAIAYWSIKETERIWKSHDDKRIVSDEVIGQAIACVIFAPNFLNLFLSFSSLGFLIYGNPSYRLG
ncbi:MAG: phosphatidylglycerophosphatase A [Bdellovibrionota bacterium]